MMQVTSVRLSASATPTLPVSLGTLTTTTWNARTYSYDRTVAPALAKTVLRTGLPNVMEAVRLLSEDQRRHPSADLGYVALVRHGATVDAVQLRNAVSANDEVGLNWIADFQPAPGVQVAAIWHVGGYPVQAWPRPAAPKR